MNLVSRSILNSITHHIPLFLNFWLTYSCTCLGNEYQNQFQLQYRINSIKWRHDSYYLLYATYDMNHIQKVNGTKMSKCFKMPHQTASLSLPPPTSSRFIALNRCTFGDVSLCRSLWELSSAVWALYIVWSVHWWCFISLDAFCCSYCGNEVFVFLTPICFLRLCQNRVKKWIQNVCIYSTCLQMQKDIFH